MQEIADAYVNIANLEYMFHITKADVEKAINVKIQQSRAFEDCETIIADEDPEDRIDTIIKKIIAPNCKQELLLCGLWCRKVNDRICFYIAVPDR